MKIFLSLSEALRIHFLQAPFEWSQKYHSTNVYTRNYMSRCVLEPPMFPADLFVLSPGYEVMPDLATMPSTLWYARFTFAVPAMSL